VNSAPDFRHAHYVRSNENPFRLTPPLGLAEFNSQSSHTHEHNSQAHVSTDDQGDSDGQIDGEISFEQVIDTVTQVVTQKKYQGIALLTLVNAEWELIKKSVFVSIISALAALALAGLSWLLVNIAIGLILHSVQVPLLAITGILLLVNVLIAIVLLYQARSAYQFIGFKRLITLMNTVTD